MSLPQAQPNAADPSPGPSNVQGKKKKKKKYEKKIINGIKCFWIDGAWLDSRAASSKWGSKGSAHGVKGKDYGILGRKYGLNQGQRGKEGGTFENGLHGYDGGNPLHARRRLQELGDDFVPSKPSKGKKKNKGRKKPRRNTDKIDIKPISTMK